MSNTLFRFVFLSFYRIIILVAVMAVAVATIFTIFAVFGNAVFTIFAITVVIAILLLRHIYAIEYQCHIWQLVFC